MEKKKVDFQQSYSSSQTKTELQNRPHRCEAKFSLLQDYARLDLLTRTSKGIFPDVLPEQGKIEEIGDGAKSSLAVPLYGNREGVVDWDTPTPEDLQVEGVIDYPVSTEELQGKRISDELWEARKKALIYGLLHYRARKLGTYEELSTIGETLMRKSIELAEKVDKDKDVEGAHEEILRLSESYRKVFEKRMEFLKGIEEGSKEVEERALEHLSEEWKAFVREIESVPFSADDENVPKGVLELREAIIDYDEGLRRAFLEGGRILDDPKEAYSLASVN